MSHNVSGDEKNISSEIELKRKLIDATEAVRRKFDSLKHSQSENKLTLEKIYEPITKPLKHLSDLTEESVKKSTTHPMILPSSTRNRSISASSGKSKAAAKTSKDDDDDLHVDDDYDDDDDMTDDSKVISMETPPLTSPSSMASYSPSFSGPSHYLSSAHVRYLKLDKGKDKYDTKYGVRIDPTDGTTTLMGNAEIRFSGDKIEIWRGNRELAKYNGSKELYDLIFLKRPTVFYKASTNDVDVNAYREILHLTNAPYKNYDSQNELSGSTLKKYVEIIRPLMQQRHQYNIPEGERAAAVVDAPSSRTTRAKSKHSGRGVGLGSRKLFSNNRSFEYVYWNRPKELVDRLRLLWASKMAGHTGHDNEIISILEELKEEGIIN